MLNPEDLSDSRCVYCGSSNFRMRPQSAASPRIQHGQIVCTTCNETNDVIDGVPFLGGYEPDDFMGLIEIIATGEMNQTPISPGYARHLNSLLAEYDGSADKEEFRRNHPDQTVRAPWFAEHRYHEWVQTHTMLLDKSIDGKKLLNVGAGYGFDSVPLIDAGAHVTCIDYSPMLVALGKKGVPEARWIGGFSHILPFKDETFDIVCANAALHHMRSVPIALREMLRVLKPGGFLYTVGDPTRPDSSSEEHEFQVFNRHEGVLSGINEGIVKFGDFYDTLEEYMAHCEIGLIASLPDPSKIDGAVAIGNGVFDDHWIPCWRQNIAALREMNGGLCIAITKRESFPTPAPTQSPFVLPAGLLAAWVADPATAFSRLMAWAPDHLVNLPFPGRQQNWFSLLNGWMAPEEPYESRRGFTRARWLLRKPDTSRITFLARLVFDGPRELETSFNGQIIAKAEIGPHWTTVDAKLDHATDSLPFLIELRLLGDLSGLSFDEKCFEVRDLVVG